MYKSLIIDDERAVHVVIKKLGKWQEFGIEPPLSARNGSEGIDLMRRIKIDIVFVDMNMPIMDGSAFLAQAPEEFPDSKFIVVSGYDDFRYAKTALRANALDYILKPIAETELNKVISRAVELLDEKHGLHIKNDEDQMQQRFMQTPQTLPPAIKTYLEENYMKDITLDSLCEKFFFTKEYLSRLFKKKYGYGIYEYVLKIRMNHAKEMLKENILQVCEIANNCGYRDSNYFSKAFKTYFNLTPSEYRTEYFSQQVKNSN